MVSNIEFTEREVALLILAVSKIQIDELNKWSIANYWYPDSERAQELLDAHEKFTDELTTLSQKLEQCQLDIEAENLK